MPDAPDEPEDLRNVADLVRRAADPFEVPADLEERTFARIGPARTAAPAPRGRRRRRDAALVGAGAAVAAAAAVLIAVLGGGGRDGTPELQGRLAGARGLSASVEVRATATGRVVRLTSSTLPVLPTGELYELWFVAPDDSRARPHRISGGTFHPDAQGRTKVVLHAAVDPAKYPVVAISEEPADGDPDDRGPDVARTRAG